MPEEQALLCVRASIYKFIPSSCLDHPDACSLAGLHGYRHVWAAAMLLHTLVIIQWLGAHDGLERLCTGCP